jgi:hypothetical protein
VDALLQGSRRVAEVNHIQTAHPGTPLPGASHGLPLKPAIQGGCLLPTGRDVRRRVIKDQDRLERS